MKNLLWIAILALTFASCAEKPQTISGVLENLGDGEIILEKLDGRDKTEIAKMNASSGVFSFEYTPEQSDLYFLSTEKTSYPFFLDNHSVVISGDIDSIETIVVKGSVANDDFVAYNESLKPANEKEGAAISDYRAAAAQQDKEKMEAAIAAYDASQEEKKSLAKAFIGAHPTSVVSAFQARINFGYGEADEIKEVIDLMDASLSGISYYDYMVERYEKLESVNIGKIAPDFTMNDPEGNPLALSSLRGKYILMDFWASWCGPCRRENPNVVAMYNEYKDKNFDIIGISLDKDKDKWLEAIEADGLIWNHVSDLKYWDSEAAQLYAVSGIPHTILLDPEGKIIAKNLRGAELEEKLAELLN